MALSSLRQMNSSPAHSATASFNSTRNKSLLSRRRTIVFGPSVLLASLISFSNPSSSPLSFHLALAQQQQLDELQQEEDRLMRLFQVSLFLFVRFSVDNFNGAQKLIVISFTHLGSIVSDWNNLMGESFCIFFYK
jgi:hypothetical protein